MLVSHADTADLFIVVKRYTVRLEHILSSIHASCKLSFLIWTKSIYSTFLGKVSWEMISCFNLLYHIVAYFTCINHWGFIKFLLIIWIMSTLSICVWAPRQNLTVRSQEHIMISTSTYHFDTWCITLNFLNEKRGCSKFKVEIIQSQLTILVATYWKEISRFWK